MLILTKTKSLDRLDKKNLQNENNEDFSEKI